MDSSASPKPEQPTASTNAAAIADLLGNPTAQQQPVGKSSRRGWVWLLVLLPLVVTGVFLSPRLLEFLPETNQTADLTGMPLYTVQRRNLQITVTEEGSLVSDENVDITCDVAGGATIIWLVDDGDRVAEGMDIVKLDASVLSENATAQKIAYEKARALMIQADKDYEAAKIAVEEYKEGLFKKDLRTAESNVTAATERLQATQNTLAYGERMFRKGYITPQQLEAQKSAVARAKLDLGTADIALDVLTKFTKPKMITELESVRDSAAARFESEKAALELENIKLERLEGELLKCTIKAPQDGLVIYANSRSRDRETEIKEGLSVKERQVILQLPDLTRMRADVEVHESKVDEISPGMPAVVRVQDLKFSGVVTSVSNRPESNWFSTAKKYVVGVRIDGKSEALRPGFTAEATIIVADLKDVIAVPVAAVIEDGKEFICAVKKGKGFERRVVMLGKSDDRFVEIVEGLQEGEPVFLNPETVLGESLSRDQEQASEWSGRPNTNE
ncbi:MAG: HlyD family efflux transporter periplasmic adaptor subunit [Phycisphaeraceae bacterium]|nr:MAG: HlyD family efflux transporter periplasmic adaptor subunit [Phycisphaeraceae bacterium]